MAVLPFFIETVPAGFPSPAEGYMEELDLQRLCIRQPEATFLLRVEGDSMIEAGIVSGDILVVDRALEARHGDVVVAEIHGGVTVKELCLHPRPMLRPRNPAYSPYPLAEGELRLFGVVTFALHRLRGLAG